MASSKQQLATMKQIDDNMSIIVEEYQNLPLDLETEKHDIINTITKYKSMFAVTPLFRDDCENFARVRRYDSKCKEYNDPLLAIHSRIERLYNDILAATNANTNPSGGRRIKKRTRRHKKKRGKKTRGKKTRNRTKH